MDILLDHVLTTHVDTGGSTVKYVHSQKGPRVRTSECFLSCTSEWESKLSRTLKKLSFDFDSQTPVEKKTKKKLQIKS